MKSQARERRNTYPPQESYTVHGLLTPEFIALGCKVEELGPLMLVTRGEEICLLSDSVTTFTSQLAGRVLKNKDLAKIMFQRAGLCVAEGYAYRKKDKDVARQRLADIGPAVIKPIDGSKGRGVSVNVTADTFDAAWSTAAEETSDKILMEKYFSKGEEARYLVVGGSCVAVLMRLPPTVYGDGASTVQQLVAQRNEHRQANPSTRGIPIEIDEHRTSILKSQGYSLDSIPRRGRKVVIDWKANISTGADSKDITTEVHESMRKVAERVACAVPGSDVVGVDILAIDHSIEPTSDNYIIIEANTQPGVGDHHYPVFGRPINVARLIAENCVRNMGFDIPLTREVSTASRKVATGRPRVIARPPAETFTLVLAGDTSLGDVYLRNAGIAEHLERLEATPGSFFEALTPLISDKSYLIANLETVLSEAPRGPLDGIKDYLGWDRPERTVATLKQIGVDAVSLANNHTMDYGPDRLVETMLHLAESGIDVVGAGNNLEEASSPLKITGYMQNIYVYAGFELRNKYRDVYRAYAEEDRPGVNPFQLGDGSLISQNIRGIRKRDRNAIIIAFPHWGGAANYRWATQEMFEANAGPTWCWGMVPTCFSSALLRRAGRRHSRWATSSSIRRDDIRIAKRPLIV